MTHRQTIQHSDLFQSALVQHSIDAIISIDADSRILLWNAAAEKIFGFFEQEALNRHIASLIIPSQYRERHDAGMAQLLATGEGPLINKTVEITACHQDGHEFPVELSLFQTQTLPKAEFTAIIRDITSRKQLERELAAKNRELKELLKRQSKQLASATQRELLARDMTENIRSELDLDTILQLTVIRSES